HKYGLIKHGDRIPSYRKPRAKFPKKFASGFGEPRGGAVRLSRSPVAGCNGLNVGTGMDRAPVVHFHPTAADMAAGARGHPNHMPAASGRTAALGNSFKIKIKVCWSIGVGLRVHYRCLHLTIHKQCDAVNAWWQSA